jgi:sortase A
MESTTTAMKSTRLRWLERALFSIGVLCLGAVAYTWLDAAVYQYRENRLLDAAAEAPPRSAASESDTLDTFRERGPGSRRRSEPAPEGTLVGRIEIPRLDVSAIVLEGVGNRTLRRGVGHIPETSLPQEGGNVGLAGHRDSFFRELKDVRKNDTIRLKTLAGTYEYRVEWIRIVQPEDTEVLDDGGAPALTLVTCYPFYYLGSAPERFIVRARRI